MKLGFFTILRHLKALSQKKNALKYCFSRRDGFTEKEYVTWLEIKNKKEEQ